jgi:FdhE protein
MGLLPCRCEATVHGWNPSKNKGEAAQHPASPFPVHGGTKALRPETHGEKEVIRRAINLARKEKPAYSQIYPFLEPLFLIQASVAKLIELSPFAISPEVAKAKWSAGFPLMLRTDFPLDPKAARRVLMEIFDHIFEDNVSMRNAHVALSRALSAEGADATAVWQSFLRRSGDRLAANQGVSDADLPSWVFLGRSCIRPSIEWTARDLLSRFPVPDSWLKGYCPVCGSLPALLYLVGEGEKMACCSWCGTSWRLHRLQCPSCDNRDHDSLGYLYTETEPRYRVQYCRLCKAYYKVIDTREMIEPPYFPLEEWTTLHLDLLAQKEGWIQPPSVSEAVYGGTELDGDRRDMH